VAPGLARLAFDDDGRPGERLPRALIATAALVIFMRFVASWMVGRYADAVPNKATLVAISASVLLSWLLMVSQAMETTTRAFYTRSDLDLILSSPASTAKLFAVRIATVALAMALMALPLAAPFIDVLVARGGWRWLALTD
jgi:ABC-2 type transport system permease protein